MFVQATSCYYIQRHNGLNVAENKDALDYPIYLARKFQALRRESLFGSRQSAAAIVVNVELSDIHH